MAVDSGRPPEADRAGQGLSGQASKSTSNRMEPTLWRHRRRLPRSSRAPGCPQDAPVVERARRQGLEVIGELELGWRLVPNEFIAVTGTNGKTTTVELIGAMHRAAGLPVAVAGNVGTPVSSLAGSVAADATIVCEASSFQLEDTRGLRARGRRCCSTSPPTTSTGTATFANYRDAKLRIFANQEPPDVAVVNARHRPCRRCAGGAPVRLRRADGSGGSDDGAWRAATTTRMPWPQPRLRLGTRP